MAKKRTKKEIEADLKRLQKAAKAATSMADLTESTGLSRSQILCTFDKYPEAYQELKEQIGLNQKNSKIQSPSKEAPSTMHEEMKSDEGVEDSGADADIMAMASATVNAPKVVEDLDYEPDFSVGFVIDASMMKIKDSDTFIDRLCLTEAKIILTSVTIKELDKMQSFQDNLALCARVFLAKAAKNPEQFLSVRIDETVGLPDDCIIAYCREYRNKVTLLTADKRMTLMARSYPYPVKVQYFATDDSLDELKQTDSRKVNKNCSTAINNDKSKLKTLIPAKLVNGTLKIFDFETYDQSICVISNDKWYLAGPQELHIGDDILIATQKSAFVTFAHYRLISLEPKDNCKLIFDRRLSFDKLSSIHHPMYQPFLEKFKKTHSL